MQHPTLVMSELAARNTPKGIHQTWHLHTITTWTGCFDEVAAH